MTTFSLAAVGVKSVCAVETSIVCVVCACVGRVDATNTPKTNAAIIDVAVETRALRATRPSLSGKLRRAAKCSKLAHTVANRRPTTDRLTDTPPPHAQRLRLA